MLVSDSMERNVFIQWLIGEYSKSFKRKVFINYELSDRLFI